jgi:hypothetical protein
VIIENLLFFKYKKKWSPEPQFFETPPRAHFIVLTMRGLFAFQIGPTLLSKNVEFVKKDM